MRGGRSTLLRWRARREELGHESRTREGQRVEEGEDGIRQQRDCPRHLSETDHTSNTQPRTSHWPGSPPEEREEKVLDILRPTSALAGAHREHTKRTSSIMARLIHAALGWGT